MTRKTLFILASGSLVLFTLMGWGIMEYFGPIGITETLQQGKSPIFQMVAGSGMGMVLGFAAWKLIGHSFFHHTRMFFANIIGPWKLSWLEILWISCCAGIGEEILFRGGIQPLLGIGWTSLLFVVLHGYITPFNRSLTLYGIFMVLVIAIIGWAAVEIGLITAMVAHAVIDIILLTKLSSVYTISEDTAPE